MSSVATSAGVENGRNAVNTTSTSDITFVQRMLAACSGSVVTSLLVTPLDVVKTRLQAQPVYEAGPVRNASVRGVGVSPELGVDACCKETFWVPNNSEVCLATPSPTSSGSSSQTCVAKELSKRQFRGTWEGLVKIAKYDGVLALWRGLSPTLAMAVPANVIYFTGYDYLRSSLPISDPVVAPLLVGGLARSLAATIISPLELFRTKLQAVARSKHAFGDTLVDMRFTLRTDGLASLWRGLMPTLWRDVPFSSIYWLSYEQTKKSLTRVSPSSMSPATSSVDTFWHSFLAGAVSGGAASILTQPFDVAKTRQQVAHRNVSMLRVLQLAHAESGVKGLFRGVVPRVLKVAPACAVMISFFELGKKLAARQNGM